MIRPGIVWAIARAETRLTRRLVRYWLFVVLSTLVGTLNFLNLWVIHHFFSANSASAAAINPRFFISGFAANFLLVFLFGLVFLGFDVRARDQRERMSEVLDALPCSNVELLLGRYIGVLVPAWFAVFGIALILLGVSYLIEPPIEPVSLAAFVFVLAPPAFLFTLGLVFLLSLLIRHRLIAAVISLGIVIGGFIVTLWWIPMYAIPLVDVTGGYAIPFPSDILGGVITFTGVVQRLAFALGGIALLLFAAAIHPRNDEGSRAVRAGAGAAILVVAAALLGSVVTY
jgi:ABC-type transport system involved in multi-copper enzyme maturation permease subunit